MIKLFYIYLGVCLYCYIKLVIGLFSKEAEVKILEMTNIKMSINTIKVLVIIVLTLLFLFNPLVMLKSK